MIQVHWCRINNLYAYVATDPAELRRAGYPVGRYNDRHIEDSVRECERVVLAWGAHAAKLERPQEVLQMLRRMDVEPHCLRLTASGHPEHPLTPPAIAPRSSQPQSRTLVSIWEDPLQKTPLSPLRLC